MKPSLLFIRIAYAAVLIAVGLGAGFAAGHWWPRGAGPTGAVVSPPAGGLFAAGPLAAALERQLAATQGQNAPVKLGVSFRATDGRFCRTFVWRTAQPLAGLACRDPGGWRLAMVMQSHPSQVIPGAAQAAADVTPAPVLEAMDQSISGQPLDAAGELKARDGGWSAKR